MSTTPAFASATEAAKTACAALGFLAAVDPTQLVTEEQAQCLQALEQLHSMSTVARASILGVFISGQGYSADADYSPRSWLIHRTRITKGAATAHTAWVRRAAAHPRVAAALSARTTPTRPLPRTTRRRPGGGRRRGGPTRCARWRHPW